MKLIVFGANGPTGRLATEMALSEGHQVTAAVRRPAEFPLQHERLDVVQVDATESDAVERAVEGHDAVLSSLGVPYTKEPVTIFSRGTAAVVQAMEKAGISRLVCVSSPGVSDEIPPEESFFARKVLAPILFRLGRTVYEDLRRMEEIVQKSDLDWTILRPQGLFDATEVTDYEVSTGPLVGRYTSRADLAHAMLREAVDDTHVRAAVQLITTDGTPSFVQMFMKEALHIGR
ncbi:NAD(P)-dependent oxidoreductase [Nocardiopsis coralliicola]